MMWHNVLSPTSDKARGTAFPGRRRQRRPGKAVHHGVTAAVVVLAMLGFAETAWGSPGNRGTLPVVAQFESAPAAGPSYGGGQWRLPAKIIAAVAITLAAAMISYFIVFPRLLRRNRRPVWPLSAYGGCTALVCVVLAAAVLALFWYDLVITDKFGGTNFWREHGARVGVLAAGLFLAWLSTAIWHSDVRASAEPAQAKKAQVE